MYSDVHILFLLELRAQKSNYNTCSCSLSWQQKE